MLIAMNQAVNYGELSALIRSICPNAIPHSQNAAESLCASCRTRFRRLLLFFRFFALSVAIAHYESPFL
jgi:hypothetical protein